jgi:hypothetical protein
MRSPLDAHVLPDPPQRQVEDAWELGVRFAGRIDQKIIGRALGDEPSRVITRRTCTSTETSTK